jgi:hypothetical protein
VESGEQNVLQDMADSMCFCDISPPLIVLSINSLDKATSLSSTTVQYCTVVAHLEFYGGLLVTLCILQLVNKSIVTDTLYLCLGDGGDQVNASISSQAGVIIFGK